MTTTPEPLTMVSFRLEQSIMDDFDDEDGWDAEFEDIFDDEDDFFDDDDNGGGFPMILAA